MVAAKVILCFVFYSFIGWIYETLLCSIAQKKWVNRGFLNGPVCPIYGFGALLILFAFAGSSLRVIPLFLSSGVLACTLEYLTSYAMEKLFHARWWDYSNRRFQLNGRICLEGFLVFGLLGVLLVRVIHPLLTRLVDRYFSDSALMGIALTCLILLLADTVITVLHTLRLNDRLAELQQALNAYRQSAGEKKEALYSQWREKFEHSRFYTSRIRTILTKKRFQDRRLFQAFPHLRSLRSGEALEKLKEWAQKSKEEK